jgi:hypothetical protein
MGGQRRADKTLPDYHGGSILNLMRSVIQACGGPALPYASLRGLSQEEIGASRNLVLLVVDGLGYNFLRRSGAAGTLVRHVRQRITSVFPSTTASAVTTLLTGLAPQQHGLTGWHMYFGEADTVAAVLPLQRREPPGAQPSRMLAPEQLFRHGSLFGRLGRRCWVVSPAPIVHSAFNVYHCADAARIGYNDLHGMFEALTTILRGSDEAKYVHAYYPELDALAHAHGVASPEVAALFSRLDEALAAFLATAAGSNTTVLITADHGFIDAPPDRLVELEHHPELAATLSRPLCGERRVAYCYVARGKRERFKAYVRASLRDVADLYAGKQLVSEGWFGPGAAHPRLAERVGDYVLVMRENWTIKDWLPGEKRHRQIGVHGGLSEDEMYVPLALARL